MQRENEYIEYKESTTELDKGLISIVSILNKHQKGKLYFGVKDDGTPIGQTIGKDTLRKISQAIANHIEPKIFPEINQIKLEGKNCIEIKFEGNDIPYFAFEKAYIRVVDEDKKISQKELKKLILKNEERNNKWEEKPSNITINEIDEETLRNFIQKGNEKGRISFKYTDKEEILKRLKLVDEQGKIKNAGYILFGKKPNIKLRAAIFATEENSTFLDMKDYNDNVFNLIDLGEQYISKNIRWSANFNTGSVERENVPEIPMRAIREILCNSYCHRLWEEPYDNTIAIYSNRIEICNPGHFTDEATPNDYITNVEPSRPRNPLIAEIMYLSGDIETWGTGIKKVYNLCKEDNIKVEFEDRKLAFYVVVYRKKIQNLIENTEKDLTIRNKKEITIILSKNEEKILKNIIENPYITQSELSNLIGITDRAISTTIRNLKNRGIIERIGANKGGYWKIKY